MKRIRTLAAAAVVLAGLGLAFGPGAARADSCNDEPFGVGQDKDLYVTVFDAGPTGLFVGADSGENDGLTYVTACVGAPDDGEPHTKKWVGAGDDAHFGGKGVVVLASDAGYFGVDYYDPYVNATPPGEYGTGAGVDTGMQTCVFAGPEYTCMASFTVVDTWANTKDAPQTATASDCVAVNGACATPALPTGAAVSAGGDGGDTLYADSRYGQTHTADIPETCVEFGAECDQ